MTTLNIAFDTTTIKKELQTLADKRMRETASWQLSRYFSAKGVLGSDTDGEGTKLIKECIDELFLDPSCQEKIKKHIAHHWERLLEEACIRAMTHKANAMAFNNEEIKNKQ